VAVGRPLLRPDGVAPWPPGGRPAWAPAVDWRPVHRLGQRGGPAVRPYHAARVAWAARGALTWPLAGASGRWGAWED